MIWFIWFTYHVTIYCYELWNLYLIFFFFFFFFFCILNNIEIWGDDMCKLDYCIHALSRAIPMLLLICTYLWLFVASWLVACCCVSSFLYSNIAEIISVWKKRWWLAVYLFVFMHLCSLSRVSELSCGLWLRIFLDFILALFSYNIVKFVASTVLYSDNNDEICMSRAMTKCVLSHMRTTKAQIRLRIRAVWSAPLLFAA